MEKAFFSVHARQCKKWKTFYKPTAATLFHCAQTNVQQPFSNTACHCELAVQHPFFETSQSCVCTTVTLSHRFKSSPAIPGNLAVPGAAGYLMSAGHFRKSHVSSGDLNRGRRTESRVLFGYFLHDAKSDKPFSLQRTSRFCKPRISPPQQQLSTNKIKTFPKGASRFCKPRISSLKRQLRTNPIKSFFRLRRFFSYFL